MSDLQGRKVFKVFNQDFIVNEQYNVTKELGQGAYGIVWWVLIPVMILVGRSTDGGMKRGYQHPDRRRCRRQEGDQCLQQEDPGQACPERDQAAPALPRPPQRTSYFVPRRVPIESSEFPANPARSHASTIWTFPDRTTSTRHICMRVGDLQPLF